MTGLHQSFAHQRGEWVTSSACKALAKTGSCRRLGRNDKREGNNAEDIKQLIIIVKTNGEFKLFESRYRFDATNAQTSLCYH